MTSYIRDFINETEQSVEASSGSTRGTRSGRSTASEPDPFPSTRGTRSTRPRTQPTQTIDPTYGLMSPDTFVGYYGTQKVTIGDLVEMGWLDEIPSSRSWKLARPGIINRLRAIPSPGGAADLGRTTADIDVPGSGGGGGGGRSGGGGGGALGPIYMNPDRAQVEDYVKAYVVATTGKAHADLIAQGVEAFLAADRKGFDSEDQAFDPQTAMKNVIRGADKYKAVQGGRPDSVDEMEWVSSRQGKLRQLGLSASLAEDVGISQAMAGATDEAIETAGQVAHTGATGRLLGAHRERLKNKALAAARLMQ